MSGLPTTERVNPLSARLDGAPLPVVVEAMLEDQRAIHSALRRALPEIIRLSAQVAATLAAGGRVIFAGAGTSGRLAALEAAECPPTFGTDPAQIVAVVAGGPAAMLQAVEGAEDDVGAGAEAVAQLNVGSADLLIAVSAGGATPFARGALDEGHRRGASSGAIVCAPGAPLAAAAAIAVVLDCGPEFVAGSTRLKAGSAQKIALNLITTGAMIQLGRVRAGRMIALRATNAKLRARALRTIQELTDADLATAERWLAEADGDLYAVMRECVAPAPVGAPAAAEAPSIRPLTESDLLAIVALAAEPEVVATTAPFGELGGDELFRAWIARPGVMLGAFSAEQLRGVVFLESRGALLREHVGDITFVAVSAGARGQGVGEALLRSALERATNLGITRVELRVWPDNASAIRLYSRLGFEIEGRLRGHAIVEGRIYDALLMAWLAPKLEEARTREGGDNQ